MSKGSRQVSSSPPTSRQTTTSATTSSRQTTSSVSRQTTTPATTERHRTASTATATPQEAATRRAELSTDGTLMRARLTRTYRSSPVPDETVPDENIPPDNTSSRPTYDGTKPAPETTNTNAARPVDAPLKGNPNRRTREDYDNVINQFAVGHNPRYAIRDSSGDGKDDTFCNIFVWDVTRAMGAEIPHWVDIQTGQPTTVYNYSQSRELNANATIDWLNRHGVQHGWRQVSAEEAQRLANEGHPTVVGWQNPGGIGHVAIVRPSDGEFDPKRGPAIAQAGLTNTNNAHVRDTFGDAPVTYWVNDNNVNATIDWLRQQGEQHGWRRVSAEEAQKMANDGYLTLVGWQNPDGKGKLATVRPGELDPERGPALAPADSTGVNAHVRDTFGDAPVEYWVNDRTRARQSQQSSPNTPSTTPPTSGQPQATTLRRGDRGEAVRILQQSLIQLGYMTEAAYNTGPGIFGPRTEAALRAFQRDVGIAADGIYGPQTQEALTKALQALAQGQSVGNPYTINLEDLAGVQIPRTGNAFIDSIAAYAILVQKNNKIPASVLIAQAMLESRSGDSRLAREAYNLFGIKGEGPAGSITLETREVENGQAVVRTAKFRKYETAKQCFEDLARIYSTSVRYEEARKYCHDPFQFAKEIQEAGYASDPKYADKLRAIIEQYNLTQFDAIAAQLSATPEPSGSGGMMPANLK